MLYCLLLSYITKERQIAPLHDQTKPFLLHLRCTRYAIHGLMILSTDWCTTLWTASAFHRHAAFANGKLRFVSMIPL